MFASIHRIRKWDRGCGLGRGESVFHGDQASAWEDEQVLETGANGSTTSCVRSVSLRLHTYTWLKR